MIEFAKKYLSHSSEITVALDELDFLERLKPAAALQYFQDLATVHADEIGIGFEEMSARNMLWVLSKILSFPQSRRENNGYDFSA